LASASTQSTAGSSPAEEPIPHTLSPHVCIEFVNSRFSDHTGSGEVYERLDMPEWRRWFAHRFDLPLNEDPGPLRAEIVGLRGLLRELLESGRDPGAAELAELNRHLARSPHWRRLAGDRSLETRWAREGWPAVMTAVAGSYCDLLIGGDLRRVRRCANPHCSWIFFDESRNASRRWCEAATCGNLVAVRRHRG
jgi:predicted RNA-binding Zn ribbon-like protein